MASLVRGAAPGRAGVGQKPCAGQPPPAFAEPCEQPGRCAAHTEVTHCRKAAMEQDAAMYSLARKMLPFWSTHAPP